MSTQVVVPALGESVKQATLIKWHRPDGSAVAVDDALCELETDKANVDIPATATGVLRRLKGENDVVNVGEVIARIEESAAASIAAAPDKKESPAPVAAAPAPAAAPAKPSPVDDLSPAVRSMVLEHKLNPREISATGPGGRITKEDVLAYLDARKSKDEEAPTPQPAPVPSSPPRAPNKKDIATAAAKPSASVQPLDFDADGIHRAPMSKIRERIAKTLVEAQHTAAILTTFNEVDLTNIMDLRTKYKDRFQEVHGIGLGFMSFFARAVVLAMREFPRVNAFLDGKDIVYHNYVHLGIAVSTDRGLAVPVLRNVQAMSFANVELEIKRLANATRDGKLGLDELSGATFTITNGGIFGSLLSTPILTPPQSGILGMHAIQKRPVVINDKIEIRSMMYVALSYDHRLVDGRESVSFLVRMKQYLEDPARLMLEI